MKKDVANPAAKRNAAGRMMTMNQIPTHVWLFTTFVVLLVAYYIRPDPVTVDLVKGFSGALPLSLRAGNDQRPPAIPPPNPQQPTK